jgi:hypothetical protein
MSDRTEREDFRATVDSIAADAHELADIEAAKRGLDPQDPEADDLSRKAEALGRRIEQKTDTQEKLSEAGGGDEGRPRLD